MKGSPENSVDGIIRSLGLVRHPEGGYFREVFRSPIPIPPTLLPSERCYPEKRSLATVIHFLLPRGDVSHFHRLRSDEIWFHHRGSPVRIHALPTGEDSSVKMVLDGLDQPHHLIPAGTWFAAEVEPGPEPFALCSCLVAPGFDFSDFELAEAENLSGAYPEHSALIKRLCPKRPS